jgi:hypothetical protein
MFPWQTRRVQVRDSPAFTARLHHPFLLTVSAFPQPEDHGEAFARVRRTSVPELQYLDASFATYRSEGRAETLDGAHAVNIRTSRRVGKHFFPRPLSQYDRSCVSVFRFTKATWNTAFPRQTLHAA